MTLIVPNMLLIGSLCRNVGKTTLAVELIKKISDEKRVCAIKFIVPHEKEEILIFKSRKFELIEEDNITIGKDTSKMLAAGAKKVFLVRALPEYLVSGFKKVLSKVPDQEVLICESNSLRKYVKPGLFIVIKRKEETLFKPSAKEVSHLADKIIETDGLSFDINTNDINFKKGNWFLS